jgi:hypothetical protein
MQVDLTTYSSIPIDGPEIYEALEPGAQVSVIFDASSRKLLWVRNWNTAVHVGYKPDFSGLAGAALLFGALAVGLIPCQLLNPTAPVLPFALGSLAAGLIAFVCWNSYRSSQASWAKAMQLATR